MKTKSERKRTEAVLEFSITKQLIVKGSRKVAADNPDKGLFLYYVITDGGGVGGGLPDLLQ